MDLLRASPATGGVSAKLARTVKATEGWRARDAVGKEINWRKSEIYLRHKLPKVSSSGAVALCHVAAPPPSDTAMCESRAEEPGRDNTTRLPHTPQDHQADTLGPKMQA